MNHSKNDNMAICVAERDAHIHAAPQEKCLSMYAFWKKRNYLKTYGITYDSFRRYANNDATKRTPLYSQVKTGRPSALLGNAAQNVSAAPTTHSRRANVYGRICEVATRPMANDFLDEGEASLGSEEPWNGGRMDEEPAVASAHFFSDDFSGDVSEQEEVNQEMSRFEIWHMQDQCSRMYFWLNYRKYATDSPFRIALLKFMRHLNNRYMEVTAKKEKKQMPRTKNCLMHFDFCQSVLPLGELRPVCPPGYRDGTPHQRGPFYSTCEFGSIPGMIQANQFANECTEGHGQKNGTDLWDPWGHPRFENWHKSDWNWHTANRHGRN